VSRMHLPAPERDPEARKPVLHEVAEGLRWLWRHAAVRTLAITITIFNVTYGAAFAVWVLYAKERLGLNDVGFGLLMTVSAVGGIIGSATYGRLERRFGLAGLMRIGLIIETLTHLALALTSWAWVAGVVMLLFGMHAIVWGTTSVTVRQRVVPEPLMGRVNSVYFLGSIGALAIGTALGGWLAQHWGVLAPFWFAFVGSAIVTAIMWKAFGNIVHDDEPAVAA
jgi:predicted MFS family arabinose efflux permease